MEHLGGWNKSKESLPFHMNRSHKILELQNRIEFHLWRPFADYKKPIGKNVPNSNFYQSFDHIRYTAVVNRYRWDKIRFEHFCTAYDKLNKADKDIRQNNDMKKLLMDMRLIDSEMEFNKILEDDNVKNQIYGYIEKVGGIDRARQSIRQPAPQQV